MKEIIAKRLKELRLERGYTQSQIAIYSDITETAYQNYELMKRVPRVEVLVKIADFYNVSLDYLTGRTDKKNII